MRINTVDVRGGKTLDIWLDHVTPADGERVAKIAFAATRDSKGTFVHPLELTEQLIRNVAPRAITDDYCIAVSAPYDSGRSILDALLASESVIQTQPVNFTQNYLNTLQ